MASEQAPLIVLRGITKRFPGVTANVDIDLALRPGEVHVLLGENGAGKSTLVGLLSGLYRPEAGAISIDGREVSIGSPRRALAFGIGTVFQHSMLVPSLSIIDNLALGGPWWRRPDEAGLAARFHAACNDIGVTLDVSAHVGALSLGERQQVEIVRALLRGGRTLLLDEATAMLTPKGAEQLGTVMRRLAARGLAVVFITHKLNEALDVGDRISVLRRGRMVGEIGTAALRGQNHDATATEVVRLMFGSAPPIETSDRRSRSVHFGEPVLRIENLSVTDPVMPLAGIDLDVAAGEILGIAGIDGNGQKQLAEAVAGQRPAGGAISLDGARLETADVGARSALGLRYVTDDRLGEGFVGGFSVATNLVLKEIGRRPFWRGGIDRPAAIAAHARALVAAFDIRTPRVDSPVGVLSGGNIQKALLARELSGPARAVIFAKPTAGLDVQNTATTRQRIREAADRGVATILISTDLDEMLELSDRIGVMAGGRIIGIVANDSAARQRVGAMISGIAA